MYYVPYMYPGQHPHYRHAPMYNYGGQFVQLDFSNQSNHWGGIDNLRYSNIEANRLLKDYGPEPFVININEATKKNNTFRTALWTGSHLQVTLMNLEVGEDIGLEMHADVDQFLRIEQGQGNVRMGNTKNNVTFEATVYDDSAIVIPAGTWHNLINTGTIPLKLYSIYAPPNHPFGTVHPTKRDAMTAEEGNS
ncbi:MULTISPECIES: cupin domain-containing protein [Paraliobacillus]|uniref:cupin domain-containing protein n=1 Tax=Paraliobacillus TaxID=200903 RepID=UPI000DD3B1F3|nr:MULTISPECIES: cupin domain-containing protein [Paraliobacillus]